MIDKIIKLIVRHKSDLIALLIVTAVTALAWHGTLRQIIEGEGYYYFSPLHSLFSADGNLTDILHEYDNFPRLSHYLLELFYAGDIQAYMNFQFITILLLHGVFYLFVRFITKNSWIAFIAAIYFAANYSGNYQIYARGHFQWFTQRVPELFPVFISASALMLYFESKKIKYYLASLFFFFIAVLTSHFTSIILPLFPALVVSTALIKGNDWKERISLALLGAPYILINYYIISGSALSLTTIRPNQTLWQSIIENKEAAVKVLHQLVVVTIPFSLLRLISTASKTPYSNLIYDLMIPVLLLYIISFTILIKRKFTQIHIFLGVFLALFGTLFLNVYVKRTNLFNEIEQGRYYFIPGIYVGIIYGIVIYNLFLQKIHKNKVSLLKYFIVILILILWMVPNINFIWGKMRSSQYSYTAGRITLIRLKELQPHLPSNSAVLLPNPIMPNGTDFLKKYYGDGTTTFLYIDSKWQEALPPNFNPENLFVYDYNNEYKLGGRARLDQIRLEDISDKYRQKLK